MATITTAAEAREAVNTAHKELLEARAEANAALQAEILVMRAGPKAPSVEDAEAFMNFMNNHSEIYPPSVEAAANTKRMDDIVVEKEHALGDALRNLRLANGEHFPNQKVRLADGGYIHIRN